MAERAQKLGAVRTLRAVSQGELLRSHHRRPGLQFLGQDLYRFALDPSHDNRPPQFPPPGQGRRVCDRRSCPLSNSSRRDVHASCVLVPDVAVRHTRHPVDLRLLVPRDVGVAT